jgi:cation:H+ antiporter
MGIGLLYLAGGILLLWQGAGLLVKNSSRLAASFGIPKIIIGLTLVAFGTSTPEMVVSLLSAIRGATDLSVGNVVGSNIVNILGILGLAALFRAIPVNSRILRIDAPVMLFFTVMAVCLGWDGLLRRWEGAVLLLCFGGYMALLIRQGRADKSGADQEAPIHATERSPGRRLRYAGFCAAGLAGLYLGGEGTIRGAVRIGEAMGIPEAIIGLTFVAGGTSLPELFTSVVAMLRKEADISVGNIIGSNIFNLGFVMSGVAVIRPLSIGIQLRTFDFWVLLATTGLACLILYWRKVVERPAGACMLVLYILYIAWMFLRMAR